MPLPFLWRTKHGRCKKHTHYKVYIICYYTPEKCYDKRYTRVMCGKAVMTSTEHRSGTDRCYEAYRNIGSDADVVINIQGDLYRYCFYYFLY